jgi:hypothetical protein
VVSHLSANSAEEWGIRRETEAEAIAFAVSKAVGLETVYSECMWR